MPCPPTDFPDHKVIGAWTQRRSCVRCSEHFTKQGSSAFFCPTHGLFHEKCSKGIVFTYCPICNNKMSQANNNAEEVAEKAKNLLILIS